MTFQIGDRVRLVRPSEDLPIGVEGRICDAKGYLADDGVGMVGVRWDEKICDMINSDGHDCDGTCDMGHGWNVDSECLRRITTDLDPVWAEYDQEEP